MNNIDSFISTYGVVMKKAFHRAVEFHGRSDRSEFWYSLITVIVVSFFIPLVSTDWIVLPKLRVISPSLPISFLNAPATLRSLSNCLCCYWGSYLFFHSVIWMHTVFF